MQQGALPPGTGQSLPSLGFALCLHSYSAVEVRGGVRSLAPGPDVTGHR